ncbi:orotidine-5'-phosphate decarboxylase [Picosynechococcus sp. PCC 73109]|uniref:orotidine-5'-phosphate decarboxylase n=1 Tax=Picosynechococcus sp. PCC 73109 TaxID=374982 RepID=UPI00074584AE|nr:orotidine-5'-phosphate decarboxylase [Picosynechococcus sp. PCC 73109]AMA08347.1 orotidine 5'-phosphate decarboxylase [Picosynechococcus sp. PCC 73109]
MQDTVIVPLDVPDLPAAIALVESLPEVTFWKVGLELFVATGPDILRYLKDQGKRIFLDLKFHDIPNTVAGACRSARAYEVDLLTIHGAAGAIALTAAKEALGDSPTKLIAITVLTSISPDQLRDDLQVDLPLDAFAQHMANLAQGAGLDGAVCSPQEVAMLRQCCGQDFTLVCPGVRPTWAQSGDQQRVMTPQAALQQGANHLVIGRPITQAADPQAAWQKIQAELAIA